MTTRRKRSIRRNNSLANLALLVAMLTSPLALSSAYIQTVSLVSHKFLSAGYNTMKTSPTLQKWPAGLSSFGMASIVDSTFDGDVDTPFESSPELESSKRLLHILQSRSLAQPSLDGISNAYHNVFRQTLGRQRFVTGRDPLLITVKATPIRRWIKHAVTASILVRRTKPDESSMAIVANTQLVDHKCRNPLNQLVKLSVELIGEINVKKPGHINVLPSNTAGLTASVRAVVGVGDAWNRWQNSALMEQLDRHHRQGPRHDRLWVSGFSLGGQLGYIHSFDVKTGHIRSVNQRSARSLLWPNEAGPVPLSLLERKPDSTKSLSTSPLNEHNVLGDALLVSDGFLVPGKDKGGLYIVKNPGNPDSERTVCLTGGHHHVVGPEAENTGWFYHRSVWIDLTGDGRQSILTARAKVSGRFSSGSGTSGGSIAETQLIWVEQPKPFRHDTVTGTPLESDGAVFDPFSPRHLPWKTHVLSEGADVMFNVADLDTEDGTIEVIASHFFGHKVTLTSILRGPEPRIVFERTIDDTCGAVFGSILVDLDCENGTCRTHDIHRVIVESGSTVMTNMPGDTFSHILVTSHKGRVNENTNSNGMFPPVGNPRNGLDNLCYSEDECSTDGGSLFAFRVPDGKDAWKTEPWLRTTVAAGFTVVRKLVNMINPGAPGFVYTFHPTKEGATSCRRPLIAIAGDCSESAYILRPIGDDEGRNEHADADPAARYKLMVEIECGATVGSIGIGYDDFLSIEQDSNHAKLYIPLFEKDKILVFAMGSGAGADDANAKGLH